MPRSAYSRPSSRADFISEPPSPVALPCPECRLHGRVGLVRIGNRRRTCGTCNAFAQNVMRLTRKALKHRHEDEYEKIRVRTELDLYPQVLEKFLAEHPEANQ